jgi:magnesium transporter
VGRARRAERRRSSPRCRQEFGLHELVEDAQSGHQRPKVEEYGDSLFVVLQTVELDGRELRLGEMDVFVGRTTCCRSAPHAAARFGDAARAASASRSS